LILENSFFTSIFRENNKKPAKTFILAGF